MERSAKKSQVEKAHITFWWRRFLDVVNENSIEGKVVIEEENEVDNIKDEIQEKDSTWLMLLVYLPKKMLWNKISQSYTKRC